jgi:hypothetical protein
MQSALFTKQYHYERHKPEETVLYKIIQENLASFLEQFTQETGRNLPDFVIKEFDEYLRCGILAHGFLRNQCEKCHKEHLVAFSCKRRGFCPSCGTRRMSETSIHLEDSVLPHKPIRQWVMTFPIPLRPLLAIRPKIMARCLEITTSAINDYYRKKSGLKKTHSKTGAVTLIQRFGGAINLNVHFHQLFVDGAYGLDASKDFTEFHSVCSPSLEELDQVLKQIIQRVTRYLEKQKIIIRDEEDNLQIHFDDEDAFARLQSSSSTYRFLTGPNKGKKALVLKTVDPDHSTSQGLVVKSSGFSLHAGVVCKADERKKLERICRYIARPAISEERLSVNQNGQVVYQLKKAYDDGTTHVVMEPLELLEKLSAIIPRPRVHLTRFHGILAPHDKHRKQVVPKTEEAAAVPVAQPGVVVLTLQQQLFEKKKKQRRMSWARLLKRVFNIDVETCGACGGKMRIIAAVEDPQVIMKILDHLGLPSTPPLAKPARGPPLSTWDDYNQTFFEE